MTTRSYYTYKSIFVKKTGTIHSVSNIQIHHSNNQAPNTAKDCTPISYADDLHSKVVVIKPEVLHREYRKATCQIALCDGGFGASPNSRGSACHCANLYTGKSTRYERSDVLGVLEGNQIPKWAQQGLKRHQQEQQKNKTQRSSER